MPKGSKPTGKGGSGPGARHKPKHSNDGQRASKGAAGVRDAATVRRLKMYKTRAVRDKKGKLIREELQSKELPSTRIQPDRRWFGNTRVIGQKQLEQFREQMASKVSDAYTVLLREKKLPLQLLEDPERKVGAKAARANLLTTQPFGDTFGKRSTRKRPKLSVEGYAELAQNADKLVDKFGDKVDAAELTGEFDELKDSAKDAIFTKGTSKRIWGELYKVLDSSDVVIEVLDARDPDGTRCKFLENHLRRNSRHKHLILLLNKCDLVPAWVTKRWLHHLSREYPTLAFHASITNPFGKGSLLSLLRQLARLRSDKQAISVGFVGYPNVGKSSVINTLRTKKVCKSAPVPGETKVWQYITLMKRIFLIDCPGVVYNKTGNSEADSVLKGVVRVEALEDATAHVGDVLKRVKPEYLRRAYHISSWTDSEDFLSQLAVRAGKLLKGGDPDLNTAARMVLYDWQRGKVPFFTLPPGHTEEKPQTLLQVAAPSAGTEAARTSTADVDAEAAALSEAAGAADAAAGASTSQAVFAQAVTEEDAQGEAGARPEQAAAGARAVRAAAAAALRAQRRGAIPVKEDYYLPADLAMNEEEVSDEEDAAGISSEEGEEDEWASGSEQEGEEELSEAGTSSSAAGSDSQEDGSGDEEAAAQLGGRGAKRRRLSGAGAGPGPKDGAGDGNESDGYGDGGLSWEAVLQAVQGTTSAAPQADEDAAKEPQQRKQQPAKKRRRSGAASDPADQQNVQQGSKKQRVGSKKQQRSAMQTLE